MSNGNTLSYSPLIIIARCPPFILASKLNGFDNPRRKAGNARLTLYFFGLSDAHPINSSAESPSSIAVI